VGLFEKGPVRRLSEFTTKLQAIVERFSDDASLVDGADAIPFSHLDALAAVGLYGAFAPVAEGGLGLGLGELCGIVEELASACLASTFVMIQHFRLLAAVLDPFAPPLLRGEFSRVVGGETKGGVALGGLLPGPAKLIATPTQDGWLLDGEAPWVSGWGLIDQLYVAARGPNDTVVNLVVEAKNQSGLVVSRHNLSALNATVTVKLNFNSMAVEGNRFIGQVPYDPSREAPEGLRVNGSLALGVARRSCTLLGPTPLDDELRSRRDELDQADAGTMALARAGACELAVRASHALAVERGSSSVLQGDVAERTAREAALLLTFGSRPAIRRALLEHFGVATPT
jgi:alkylation response protein AidB-like acyl-CoA dehydrogenase